MLRVGQHQGEDGSNWLVRDVRPWSAEHRRGDQSIHWIVSTCHQPPGAVMDIPPYAIGRLDFGQGPWSDFAWGTVCAGGRTVSLDMLDLIGSGFTPHPSYGGPGRSPGRAHRGVSGGG